MITIDFNQIKQQGETIIPRPDDARVGTWIKAYDYLYETSIRGVVMYVGEHTASVRFDLSSLREEGCN